MREQWRSVTRERPELFAAFAACEDPGDHALDCWLREAAVGGRRVLELACGSGRATGGLAARAREVLALDRSGPLLAQARRGLGSQSHLSFLRADARRIPLAAACCERVVARHFLAYLRPETQAVILAEAERVLRPGGEIWLLETHWEGEWMRARGREGPWSEAEVRPLVEELGFALAGEVSSSIRFPSLALARELLAALVGPQALEFLSGHGRLQIEQRLVLLRRGKASGGTVAAPVA